MLPAVECLEVSNVGEICWGGGEDLIVCVFKNGDRYFSIVFLGNIPATPLSSPQKKENKQKNNRFERS